MILFRARSIPATLSIVTCVRLLGPTFAPFLAFPSKTSKYILSPHGSLTTGIIISCLQTNNKKYIIRYQKGIINGMIKIPTLSLELSDKSI